MIALGGRSEEVSKVSPAPNGTLDDSEQTVADLRRERDEALAREAALAEVLQVVNSSPGDLAPVFEFHAAATRGYWEKVEHSLRHPYSLGANSPVQALLNGEPLVEIPDVIGHQVEAPTSRTEAVISLGICGVLFVPLRRDSLLLGMTSAARSRRVGAGNAVVFDAAGDHEISIPITVNPRDV